MIVTMFAYSYEYECGQAMFYEYGFEFARPIQEKQTWDPV